jgi:hypothetical protein
MYPIGFSDGHFSSVQDITIAATQDQNNHAADIEKVVLCTWGHS